MESTQSKFGAQTIRTRKACLPWLAFFLAAGVTGCLGPKARAAEHKKEKLLFLVAREQIHDPFFEQSVVLMLPLVDTPVEVGLIINKTANVSLQKIFPDNPVLAARTELAHFGGPVDVQVPGLIFQSPTPPENALLLYSDVYLALDSDQVAPLLEHAQPSSKTLLFLGRAQWAPEQLQNEIHRGDWYEVHEDGELIFTSDPHTLWRTLHARMAPSKYIKYDLHSRPPASGSNMVQ